MTVNTTQKYDMTASMTSDEKTCVDVLWYVCFAFSLVRRHTYSGRQAGTDINLTRAPVVPQIFHHLRGGGVNNPVYLGSQGLL